MWDVLLSAGASLLGGALSGEGARKAGKAEADAANQNIALQRDVYLDQRGLARPGYLTGGAATNKLAGMYGIKSQDYEAAYGGTGGGTNSLNNPHGQSDQWASYLTSNPDVMDYWKGNAKLRELYPNANDFAAYHYANFGQQEGRQLPAAQASAPSTGAGTATSASPATASDPMAEFLGSMENRLATEATELDFSRIKGQLGAAGKTISGPAEARYAKTLAGNRMGAFGDYKNGLRLLAGMGTDAGSQISGAAGQYGVNAGNAITNGGQAKGNALRSAYGGMTQGLSAAAGTMGDFFKAPKSTSSTDPARAAYPGYY